MPEPDETLEIEVPSAAAGTVTHVETTDNLDLLLAVLPDRIRAALADQPVRELLEIVLDLGRPAEARFPGTAQVLGEMPVTREELDYTVGCVGSFSADNRAGIESTLHRIAALRNRRGEVVGLTCRVGRAVSGTVEIIRDLIASGQSVLLLGRPGIGKTTLLRESARVLAGDFSKRVVVVDTSNEIAGDGDIPHPGIGRARRLQVPSPHMQHALMIEAVENHMPEVVVVDEIGTHDEALAARTIAERGVQLVATAHGTALENLIANPTLADLVGGIGSVTLGDDEARRRRTQKTVLERKAAPTFDILIEVQDRYRFAVHRDVAAAVDAHLAGRRDPAEIRERREDGGVDVRVEEISAPIELETPLRRESRGRPKSIYPFAVSASRLTRAIRELDLPLEVTHELRRADVVIALRRADHGKQVRKLEEARRRRIPIMQVRADTVAQLEKVLAALAAQDADPEPAIREAEAAVQTALAEHRPVALTPHPAAVRREQHQVAESHGLPSVSEGNEPRRHVTIYPPLAGPTPLENPR